MTAATFSFEPVTSAPSRSDIVSLTEARLPAQAPVVFDIVTTRAGFDQLSADWTALFDRAGRHDQTFLQFNWLWHWANHYLGPADRLAIVTARRNNQLILVWPLVVERVAGLIQLSFMGAPVSQYGDVLLDHLADADAVLDGAWSHLRRHLRFDLIRLAKVRADAVVAGKLDALGFTVTAEEEAPAINLDRYTEIAQVEARQSHKHVKNRRRQLRRLQERGPLAIELPTACERARDAVRQAMTLKRAWLNDKALVSKAFKDERIDAFFADAATSRTRPCGVEASVLSTNGEAGNAIISVTCKGRRAVHIVAYGLKFDRYGIGNHHLVSEIERAMADGVRTYDFLAPRHSYKMDWADHVVAVRDHTLAISPLGRLYVDIYVARLREALKRGIARLPPGVRRWFATGHRTVG